MCDLWDKNVNNEITLVDVSLSLSFSVKQCEQDNSWPNRFPYLRFLRRVWLKEEIQRVWQKFADATLYIQNLSSCDMWNKRETIVNEAHTNSQININKNKNK